MEAKKLMEVMEVIGKNNKTALLPDTFLKRVNNSGIELLDSEIIDMLTLYCINYCGSRKLNREKFTKYGVSHTVFDRKNMVIAPERDLEVIYSIGDIINTEEIVNELDNIDSEDVKKEKMEDYSIGLPEKVTRKIEGHNNYNATRVKEISSKRPLRSELSTNDLLLVARSATYSVLSIRGQYSDFLYKLSKSVYVDSKNIDREKITIEYEGELISEIALINNGINAMKKMYNKYYSYLYNIEYIQWLNDRNRTIKEFNDRDIKFKFANNDFIFDYRKHDILIEMKSVINSELNKINSLRSELMNIRNIKPYIISEAYDLVHEALNYLYSNNCHNELYYKGACSVVGKAVSGLKAFNNIGSKTIKKNIVSKEEYLTFIENYGMEDTEEANYGYPEGKKPFSVRGGNSSGYFHAHIKMVNGGLQFRIDRVYQTINKRLYFESETFENLNVSANPLVLNETMEERINKIVKGLQLTLKETVILLQFTQMSYDLPNFGRYEIYQILGDSIGVTASRISNIFCKIRDKCRKMAGSRSFGKILRMFYELAEEVR